jgi:hypothetical protein
MSLNDIQLNGDLLADLFKKNFVINSVPSGSCPQYLQTIESCAADPGVISTQLTIK